MEWLQPYITETVGNIEKVSDELWDFFLDRAEGDLSGFKEHKNSFGKSALYANIALGLSLPELSDAISENMGASSPKTPTGKEEMMEAGGFFGEIGMALDVSDRITAEWDMSAKAAGGFDQAETRTYENVRRLIETVRAGPPEPPAPQEVALAPQELPPQSLLVPEA